MKTLVENITDLYKNRIELLKTKDNPKIGWISIYTPEEIFYAAGLIPFRITGEQGIDLTDASAFLGSNFCSYVLSCLSEGLGGIYPFMEGIVFLDSCDMRKRLYEVWVHNVKPRYSFFLELPKAINQPGREYFRLQIRKLITSIESHFDYKISDVLLQKAIDLCNESRRLLKELYDMRKSDTFFISSTATINIIKACTSGLKEEFNERLKQLLLFIKKQDNNGTKKKHRVMISGSYFDNSGIIDTIEKMGAHVVCEDISNGVKYLEGEIPQDGDPVEAIADYYYEKGSCARIIDTERRFNHMMNLIKEYGIESVIYFSLKFCDTNFMDFPYFKNKLAQNGIPVLLIEGEQNMTNIENLRTRIQTFLETRMFS
ncbi:MAG: 2-hydroxyacyl-CoA dehydratase [Spirochaetales bacterium]|nr:2-hydroxyacyl-CoA dehydratase [Spirochaetales bacterium]